MKTIIIIILTIHFSLFIIISFSQSCLPDGIYFGDQEQIVNFQTNYLNCTEIEGDMTITDFWQAKRWLLGR